jgi:GT2 family glycosyltransferase
VSGGRVLVVVPVLGHHDMTHELLADLSRERDRVDVVVVDNGGDYPAVGNEAVVRPGTNLGWAAGTNLGTTEHLRSDHAGVVWLNNDTRLSDEFVDGLGRAGEATQAGIVGPFYDCFWRHQRLARDTNLAGYRRKAAHFRVPFVDGVCMYVTAPTIAEIGVLDAETFGLVGWGADVDYCLRARAAGIDIVVTRLSFLHHDKSVTGKTVYDGLEGYAAEGFPALVRGLEAKWGPDWRRLAAIEEHEWQTRPVDRRARVR